MQTGILVKGDERPGIFDTGDGGPAFAERGSRGWNGQSCTEYTLDVFHTHPFFG